MTPATKRHKKEKLALQQQIESMERDIRNLKSRYETASSDMSRHAMQSDKYKTELMHLNGQLGHILADVPRLPQEERMAIRKQANMEALRHGHVMSETVEALKQSEELPPPPAETMESLSCRLGRIYGRVGIMRANIGRALED